MTAGVPTIGGGSLRRQIGQGALERRDHARRVAVARCEDASKLPPASAGVDAVHIVAEDGYRLRGVGSGGVQQVMVLNGVLGVQLCQSEKRR